MIRNDYMMRQIKQLTEAIARLVGLARSGKADEAMRAIDDEYTSKIGLPRATLERLDARSVVMLIGEAKVELLAMLLEAEAEVLRGADKVDEAERRLARAAALRAR